MVQRIATVAFEGIDARAVDVQVQVAPGLPAFNIVGLPDKAVAESRERVRAALGALGLALPPRRITVNLAPADVVKEGSHFDLPIALGLLAAMDIGEYLAEFRPNTQVYVGGVVATDVTSWANLQLCFALPRLDWATSPIPRRSYKTNLAATPIAYSQGKTFSLPTAPGLGTALSFDHLTRYIRRDTANPTSRPATQPQ